MGVFQGHQILALVVDFLLPLVVLIAIVCFVGFFKSNKTFLRWLVLVVIFFLIVFWWPNSVYAMLEIKHLVMVDTVADIPDLFSYLVFGGISLYGYLMTILGNRWMIRNLTSTVKNGSVFNAFLAITGGFGAVAGLLNLYSVQAFISPWIVVVYCQWLLYNPAYLLFSLLLSILLFLSTQPFLRPS